VKKKIITFALFGLLAVGSIVPMAAKAMESWSYGFNQSGMYWYNYYIHSGYKHYGTITKNGVTWYGPVAQPNYWSRLELAYNGPYAATYNKYVIY
jgi:hypothetical protein